jgi:hypothetical protein
MARGLDLAHACVVCVGPTTPDGWCQQEIERALDIQSRDQDFRVIPLLLPGASTDAVPPFLGLRTWVDFRHGVDEEYQLHRLKCGIKGEAPGPWPGHSSAAATNSATDLAERKLRDLQRLEKYVPREVVIETQKKILNRWLKT